VVPLPVQKPGGRKAVARPNQQVFLCLHHTGTPSRRTLMSSGLSIALESVA
jgi:hypothetical protein